MQTASYPVLLVIMDGWGIPEDPAVSAIDHAHVPFYRHLLANYAHTKLLASGVAVGLPDGQMGNSEVGHMNLGAGRIVFQDLERIGRALRTGAVKDIDVYQQLITYCKQNHRPLHLLGLVSDGGVHSALEHLQSLLKLLKDEHLPAVYLHAFTDGRDTDPRSGLGFMQAAEQTMRETGVGRTASVVGRYYAMDRDKRWERVRLAYDLLVHGKGEAYASATEAIEAAYAVDQTDEFLLPKVMVDDNGQPVATLQTGDAVLFFNFRTDRGRELTQALTQQAFPEHEMQPLTLHYATMTRYDNTFKGVEVLFEKEELTHVLGEVLAGAGKTQLRIAETEKYPHVTFFFNGGREEPYPGEQRIMCPSPKVATYDLKPEMSAYEVRDAVLPVISKREADFICLNFANPDMVGHTGVFEAAVKAVETTDQCVQAVVKEALTQGYACIVLADHGNADKMRNPDGSPHTAHTLVPVPCIVALPHGAPRPQLQTGVLGDVAPTVLTLMGLAQPAQMTGQSLIVPTSQQVLV